MANLGISVECKGTYIQERAVYFGIDPLFLREVFTNMELMILVTLSFPMGIASTLLLIFWWQEILTSKFTEILPSLNKFKIPFIITSVLLVIIDISFR